MSEAGRRAFSFPGGFIGAPAEWLRTLAHDLADPYRPELHYMRGPGPKWREKHGLPPATQIGDFGLPTIWKSGA